MGLNGPAQPHTLAQGPLRAQVWAFSDAVAAPDSSFTPALPVPASAWAPTRGCGPARHPRAVSGSGSLCQAGSWPPTCRLMSPSPGRCPGLGLSPLSLQLPSQGWDRPCQALPAQGPPMPLRKEPRPAILQKGEHWLQNSQEAAPVCLCCTKALLWNCTECIQALMIQKYWGNANVNFLNYWSQKLLIHSK